MSEQSNFDESPLIIKFTGFDMFQKGVAIYDLATCLLAVQRIVNKAHLAAEGNLSKGAKPNRHQRSNLALTIGERRKQSDAYSLIAIASDPLVQQATAKLIDYALSGIAGYYTASVLDRISKEKDQNKQIFIGSIHSEVVNIVNRIDAAGGVESIQIGTHSDIVKGKTIFNAESRDYVNRLADEVYYGQRQAIKGRVYKLYPNSKIATIRRAGGKTVDMHLSDADFDKIRFDKSAEERFTFTGRARYKIGSDDKSISDFDVDEVSPSWD